MSIDIESLREITKRLVTEMYEKRRAPIPGAIVRPALTKELSGRGESLDLQNLKLKSFLEFVDGVPGISVQRRPGSDFLVAPANATEVLAAFAEDRPRIRRDFWRAFVEFPIANSIRLYDLEADSIRTEQVGTSHKGIEIEPVPLEIQLQWRKEFGSEQSGEYKTKLLAISELPGRAPFNEFARFMRDNPNAFRAWDRYQQKQISGWIERWAQKHGLTDNVWTSVSRSTKQPITINRRTEVYNVLDQIPIDDLLQIKVPLEWLVKFAREK